MNQGFWANIKKPVFVLAPMADVTDASFRQVIAKYGKPDVTWTEFVSADGLVRAPEEGKRKLLKDLEYTEAERPIVAQLFTSNPDHMEQAAKLCAELGFDGVDINMGCPDKSIEKQNAGAALIKHPKLARELIERAREGVRKSAKDIPISVKTRVGYNKVELEEWLPELLAEEPAVITIHARTRKEMSKVPARWEHVKRAVEIRNKMGRSTLIFGNGDVKDLEDARKKVEETGCDGIMLGRAIFGNPWLFAEREPNLSEKLHVMIEHTKLFEELLGDIKSFSLMKKHYKAYVNGFDGAVELRGRLMETTTAKQVEEIVDDFLSSKQG
jgi:nifR3 family TIM-barrel protein